MSIRNHHVLYAMFKEEQNRNIFWKYLGRPVCYIFGIPIAMALIYLYLVPFTNVIGQALFADYKCPVETGIWQVCGQKWVTENSFNPDGSDVGVGFLVFLLIQGTIGFFLLSLYMFGHSRKKGYVKQFRCFDFWCSCFDNHMADEDNWHQVTDDQTYLNDRYCKAGPCLFYNASWIFAFSIILSTIMIGIWFGRYIAVHSISQCIPYVDTKIGMYGCVSNTNGAYVGGKDCINCAGTGFGILGMPLLIAEVLVIVIYYFIKNCRTLFIEEKIKLEREKKQEISENYDMPSL